MAIIIEDTLLEINAEHNNLRLLPMFGNRGIFYKDVFVGYLNKDNNSLFLRTCCLTDSLLKRQPLLEVLYINYAKCKREQKAYLVPKEYISTKKELEVVLDNAAADRQKIESQQFEANNLRIKSLPNMTVGLERQLKNAGINTATDLINEGTKNAFKKMIQSQPIKNSVILKIEGAIAGCHEAVIPSATRQELIAFANEEIDRHRFSLAS